MKTYNDHVLELCKIYEEIATGEVRPYEAQRFQLGVHVMSDQYLEEVSGITYTAREKNDLTIVQIEASLIRQGM